MISTSQRSILEIKEALSVVDKSINNYSQYVDVYPDDDALKFSLHSAKNLQINLLKELEEAYALKHKSLFDICLTQKSDESGLTPSSEIPTSALGGILTTFQELLTALIYRMSNKDASKGRIPENIRRISSVNVATTGTGSFRIVFSDNPTLLSYSDQPTLVHDALETMNNMVFNSNDLPSLKKAREEYGLRVFSKYKRFIESIAKNNLDVIFYDQLRYGDFTRQKINATSSKRINTILTTIEERPAIYEKFTGKLDTLGQKDRLFKFYADDGQVISGKFIKNLSGRLSKWDFNKQVCCEFKHERQYIEAQDREIDRWTLIKVIDVHD